MWWRTLRAGQNSAACVVRAACSEWNKHRKSFIIQIDSLVAGMPFEIVRRGLCCSTLSRAQFGSLSLAGRIRQTRSLAAGRNKLKEGDKEGRAVGKRVVISQHNLHELHSERELEVDNGIGEESCVTRVDRDLRQDMEEARPPGISKSFYKRELPSPPSTAFSSAQGQKIFADAMSHGMLQGFFPLIEQFRTQDEPAFCGLASIAMVLNSLAIDPRRRWKGPWRIFHEKMLDCCIPLETVQQEGITLSQAACLARCNGAGVDLYQFGSVSEGEFRDMIQRACSGNDFHLIVSYSRQHFLQTGDGHFSPIGGYSPTHDMTLILDTARFKYPPHWVPVSMLYEAMAAKDPTTKQPRGFMKISAAPVLQSVLFALDVRGSLEIADEYFRNTVPRIVRSASRSDFENNGLGIILNLAHAIPREVLNQFLATRISNPACNDGSCVQADAVETLLSEIRLLPLFSKLKVPKDADGEYIQEKMCIIILMARKIITKESQGMDSMEIRLKDTTKWLETSPFKVIQHEIAYLEQQYNAIKSAF